MYKRAYHTPVGDPCQRCGLGRDRHLVDHMPEGNPCGRVVSGNLCGLPEEKHYRKFGNVPYKEKTYYVGIDGEGQGRTAKGAVTQDDDHRYVMLAWSNEDGSRRDRIEAAEGERLTTVQCLDFILAMPLSARAFAFAFNYDLTKILMDLDDRSLYRLFRPELRQRKKKDERKKGPIPVYWKGYAINLMGSKFSVAKGGRRHVIWDVFKFFQAKFTSALEDWFSKEDKETKERIWSPPEMGPVVARMRHMKDQRKDFDRLTRKEILEYCYDECAYMARLAHKLTAAHEAAGLHLRSYHGAGSTASAILKMLGTNDQGIDKEVRTVSAIKHRKRIIPFDKVAARIKDHIQVAIASAFFGGRFENLVIGDIPGPIWGYDISSAYPYQCTFLPCLGCGYWEHVTREGRLTGKGVTTAIVRYKLGKPPRGIQWGPFPFRMKDGSIAFPSTSGGGWVWLAEYLQGKRLFPHVEFQEAWVYRTKCDHKPFAKVPRIYLERLKLGKEGAGIVLKLGSNAIYGKTAQSTGIDPPFQSWIWAGMITAGTRAQILELIGLHKKRSNVLMIATDGIYSREKLDTPKPKETGTGPEFARDENGEVVTKPLGGWERKVVQQGMFAARPGIYFPLNPTEKELKAVRARGVGRGVMLANWRAMVDAWRAGKPGVKLQDVSRFHGAKSSISIAKNPDADSFAGSYVYQRAPMLGPDGKALINPLTGKAPTRYGQWTSRPVGLNFDPLPKREGINKDGTLRIRAFGPKETSKPYERSVMTIEAVLQRLTSIGAFALFMQEIETAEQPDGGDFSDYESDPE